MKQHPYDGHVEDVLFNERDPPPRFLRFYLIIAGVAVVAASIVGLWW